MKKIFKNPKILGNCAFYYCKILQATLRLQVTAHPNYNNKQPYLFAFWHGKQLLPIQQLVKHLTPNVALVSPSRDGEILATWLTKLGYDVIRGSSRDGNVRGTVAMLQKLKQGCSVGFGVDGPIGPIYQVKPGITYMAQKSKVAIIPLGSAFAKKWTLHKAWDKYEIPQPFSKASYYIGEPFLVTDDMDLTEANTTLEQLLQNAEAKAQELLLAQ